MEYLPPEKVTPLKDIWQSLGIPSDVQLQELSKLNKHLGDVYLKFLDQETNRKNQRLKELKTFADQIGSISRDLDASDDAHAKLDNDLSTTKLESLKSHLLKLQEEKKSRGEHIAGLVKRLLELMKRLNHKMEDRLAAYKEGSLGYSITVIKALENKEKELVEEANKKKKKIFIFISTK